MIWLSAQRRITAGLLFILASPVFGSERDPDLKDASNNRQQIEPEQIAWPAGRKASSAFFAEYVGLLESRGGLSLVSLNFDQMISENFSLRAGLGLVPAERQLYVFVPVVANVLIGKGDHKLELGLGVTVFPGAGPLANLSIGYRYAPRKGGFSVRLGVSNLFFRGYGLLGLPLIGISLGAQFGLTQAYPANRG